MIEVSIPVAEAKEVTRETLQEQAKRIANTIGISKEKLYNLIESESGWDPTRYNEQTEDRGITQISSIWHSEVSDECAYEPECAITWTAKLIKGGREHEYVVCNCYLFASLFTKLPRMAEIIPNGPPQKGGIVIFQYGELKHIAFITGFSTTGDLLVKEANYEPCKTGTREVTLSDPKIVGFWAPQG